MTINCRCKATHVDVGGQSISPPALLCRAGKASSDVLEVIKIDVDDDNAHRPVAS